MLNLIFRGIMGAVVGAVIGLAAGGVIVLLLMAASGIGASFTSVREFLWAWSFGLALLGTPLGAIYGATISAIPDKRDIALTARLGGFIGRLGVGLALGAGVGAVFGWLVGNVPLALIGMAAGSSAGALFKVVERPLFDLIGKTIGGWWSNFITGAIGGTIFGLVFGIFILNAPTGMLMERFNSNLFVLAMDILTTRMLITGMVGWGGGMIIFGLCGAISGAVFEGLGMQGLRALENRWGLGLITLTGVLAVSILVVIARVNSVPDGSQARLPVAAAIAWAANTQTPILDLSGYGLTSLPLEVTELTELQRLNLNNNALTGLPPEIGRLANLERLHLENNALTSLPPEMSRLTRLRYLYLGNNRFHTFPAEINSLPDLIWLDLKANQITGLLPDVSRMRRLSVLILGNNDLKTFPAEIDSLTELTWLNLDNNDLAALPPEIGGLSNLDHLELNGNHLTALPPEIGQLAELEWLELAHNNLTTLPPEFGRLQKLTHLRLDGNQFTAVPPVLAQIPRLKFFDLSGNPVTSFSSDGGASVEWQGQIFHLGDRVKITVRAGTFKPHNTGHPVEIDASAGHVGVITGFTSRQPGASPELARVKWEPQAWTEWAGWDKNQQPGKTITLAGFESTLHLDYLAAITEE